MNQSEKKAPGNLIRKWAVVDAKDISRTETWLEDMAAQGLFFHSFSRWSILAPGPLWVVLFQVDVPKPRRRYRLCPARPQEAEPTQETLELYAQSGWQFLRYWGTSCVSYYLFYTDDPNALEPYTDPDSLYEALRPPKKDVLNDLLLGVVLYTSAVILSATQILDRQLSFLPNWILAAAAALLRMRSTGSPFWPSGRRSGGGTRCGPLRPLPCSPPAASSPPFSPSSRRGSWLWLSP